MRRRLLAIISLPLIIAACTPAANLPKVADSAPTAVVSTAAPAVVIRTATPEPSPTSTPTPTRTPVPTVAPTRTPKPGQALWLGDLHMHTRCSDGWGIYEQMVQKALALGLDFMAVTDHNAFYNETRNLQCAETIAKCRAETRLLCIAGEEEQGWGVHLVALGIPGDMDPLPTMAAQVAQIHQKGGLAIAAHPFSSNYLYTEDQLFRSGLDAMECSADPAENQRQSELSKKYGVPCIYDSDAHSVDNLGDRISACTVPVNSLADLKAALAGGKCRLK